MKKLLFITYGFGNSTPVGVGAERIVSALANHGFQVYVITSKGVDSTIPNVDITIKRNTPRLPFKTSSKLSIFLGKELYYLAWEIKAYFAAKAILYRNQDIVAIYTRAVPISVCPIGIKLKKKFHIPLLMHFTDPIPAPPEWLSDKKSRKRLIKQMQGLLPQANRISFGNRHMLWYEENVLNISLQNKAFISPDPGPSSLTFLPQKKHNDHTINLLFLGNIYGNRNPSYLFEAIKQLSTYPIKFYLFGSNRGDYPEFVVSKGRTDDIISVMQESDILVDIDGNDETPVFISSKLKDYLSVNRPILSITPLNSPSREILCGLSTVGIAINELQEIKKTILKLINTKYSDYDFNERIPILETFSSDQIVLDIIEQIDIINN